MKYIDEFRQKTLIRKLACKIRAIAPRQEIKIMEVCGTHTQSFFRFGLRQLLPDTIKLVSGPGCPVCVSPQGYIDQAIKLSQDRENCIITFGDMLRLPGSSSCLEREKAKGADVRVVYSALDSLNLARQDPRKNFIFLAVGFETTAPTIALSILSAERSDIGNLCFLPSLKLMPPALRHLLKDKRLNLQGLLCPGHVSAIIGLRPYSFIPREFQLPCCVAGFEPLDVLEGVYFLIRQIIEGKPQVDNQYSRVVTKIGNKRACEVIKRVFMPRDATWRGLGVIPGSGLNIKSEFFRFDAENVFRLGNVGKALKSQEKNCHCADVLKGLISPLGCALFARKCTPLHPVGPCMVSSEGSCSIYYKYNRHHENVTHKN